MMQNRNWWMMAMMAFLSCTSFISCTNEDDGASEEQVVNKSVVVGLSCGGELLEITNSPLSRAATYNQYIIQVHEVPKSPDGNEKWIPYACGRFTSLSGVTIRLSEGKKYIFRVGIIIGCDGPITNSQFKYTNQYSESPKELERMKEGYYGELEYVAEEGVNVSIDTKRVSYGVKMVAESLSEGFLTVNIREDWNTLPEIKLTPVSPIYESIYTFSNVNKAWAGNSEPTGSFDPSTGEPIYVYKNYTSNATLNVNWTKPDGTVLPIGTYNVKFERNVKSTILIKAE